jgi:hypothetical protein
VIIADFAFITVAHSTNLPQPQPAFVEALPLSITARLAFFGQSRGVCGGDHSVNETPPGALGDMRP